MDRTQHAIAFLSAIILFYVAISDTPAGFCVRAGVVAAPLVWTGAVDMPTGEQIALWHIGG